MLSGTSSSNGGSRTSVRAGRKQPPPSSSGHSNASASNDSIRARPSRSASSRENREKFIAWRSQPLPSVTQPLQSRQGAASKPIRKAKAKANRVSPLPVHPRHSQARPSKQKELQKRPQSNKSQRRQPIGAIVQENARSVGTDSPSAKRPRMGKSSAPSVASQPPHQAAEASSTVRVQIEANQQALIVEPATKPAPPSPGTLRGRANIVSNLADELLQLKESKSTDRGDQYCTDSGFYKIKSRLFSDWLTLEAIKSSMKRKKKAIAKMMAKLTTATSNVSIDGINPSQMLHSPQARLLSILVEGPRDPPTKPRTVWKRKQEGTEAAQRLVR